MHYAIHHEIPGRMRLKLAGPVPDSQLDALIQVTSSCPQVRRVQVYGRIGQMAVEYAEGAAGRGAVLDHLGRITRADIQKAQQGYAVALAPRTHALLMQLARIVGAYFARRWLLPMPVRALFAINAFRPFLAAGWRELRRGRLTVPVLDAAAIGVSFLKRDPKTASQTMFLLNVGEALEDYTRASSENELIESLLSVPDSARKIEGDSETSVPAASLMPGDLIAVRTGMSICIDGVIEQGCAMVNQATLTGEPLAVERTKGDDVFAGTVVEDGDILVRVREGADKTKLRSIVSLVEQADLLKSEAQTRMERAADRIVPWNFLLAGAIALATRDISKASAALMVDYSCALKLTGSIAVMAAMSNAAKAGIMVKGARHFETFANADTIVFDKTGTLTQATPKLMRVESLDDAWSSREVLRLAACLEEHFPHPVARAVVHAAEERGIRHRERHAAVEYIVAHGIASSLDGKRVVIGSKHFVLEDERATFDELRLARVEEEFFGLSPLYLAIDGSVVGVLGIQDPIKPKAAEAIARLKSLGFKHIIMLTGDSAKTASRIAQEAGIDEWHADLLPEDKYAYLEALKAQGRCIAMVGDGVNDSPALSLADVGIAMGQGSDIAKEVADVVLSDTGLDALVDLRRLSCGLQQRMTNSYRKVVGINSALLALGVGGGITPQVSSLLHNASTVGLSLANTKRYV